MDRGYDTRSPIQKTSSLPKTFALFRVYMIFVGVILIAGVFFTFAYAPLFQIRTIEVSGSLMTPNENIQTYVSKVLEGNWRTLVPFNTSLGIPTQRLQNHIMQVFPSVHAVKVDRVGVSSVRILITEKIPVFVYCKQDTCALLDRNGVALTLSPKSVHTTIQGSPAQFTQINTTKTNDIVALGTPLLPDFYWNTLNTVNVFLDKNKFIVKNISLAPLGFFDITAMSVDSGAQVEFRFRANKKIEEQLHELQLALDKGLLEKINNNSVEYVISYVPQKVIYKNIERYK